MQTELTLRIEIEYSTTSTTRRVFHALETRLRPVCVLLKSTDAAVRRYSTDHGKMAHQDSLRGLLQRSISHVVTFKRASSNGRRLFLSSPRNSCGAMGQSSLLPLPFPFLPSVYAFAFCSLPFFSVCWNLTSRSRCIFWAKCRLRPKFFSNGYKNGLLGLCGGIFQTTLLGCEHFGELCTGLSKIIQMHIAQNQS